ncbi:hypothetical protein ACF8FF_07340 [Pseudomonas sp. zjy_13]|uniref:hypothetical protein n=1 Tax=Pseudomonas sp. zjy_13 TaxID=3367263 RepID=UPI00370BBC7F
MKDKNPIAQAAAAALKTHPPQMKVATQDLAELKQHEQATAPASQLAEILWGKFDDAKAPEVFLPELHRMRADIQRSLNMTDAEGILGQTYGLTKALELLGVDKTIALGIYHRMQAHVAARRADLSRVDRPQI